jgi:hypothetical protein
MSAGTGREDRGRNHRYRLDGEHVDGVTTILSNGLPKPALINWAARTTAEFVADRLALDGDRCFADRLLADLRKVAEETARDERDTWPDGPPGPLTIANTLKGVHWLDRDRAGNRGTEVHHLAHHLALGEELDVPEELVGHVDSYLRFRDDWQPTEELLEFVVLNRRHRYMGTADLACRLPGLGFTLVDLKTNRSGPFPEVALQLAGYRYAEAYLDGDGEEMPMPEFDGCAVLWLRADGYDLVPFEAGPDEFRFFLYVQQVARFVTAHSKTVKGDALVAGRVAS